MHANAANKCILNCEMIWTFLSPCGHFLTRTFILESSHRKMRMRKLSTRVPSGCCCRCADITTGDHDAGEEQSNNHRRCVCQQQQESLLRAGCCHPLSLLQSLCAVSLSLCFMRLFWSSLSRHRNVSSYTKFCLYYLPCVFLLIRDRELYRSDRRLVPSDHQHDAAQGEWVESFTASRVNDSVATNSLTDWPLIHPYTHNWLTLQCKALPTKPSVHTFPTAKRLFKTMSVQRKT